VPREGSFPDFSEVTTADLHHNRTGHPHNNKTDPHHKPSGPVLNLNHNPTISDHNLDLSLNFNNKSDGLKMSLKPSIFLAETS